MARATELRTPEAEAAPAKINLYLHVTGHREDGFHLLDSLIAFAGIGDLVEVGPASRLSLSVEGPFAEGLTVDPALNLATRAVSLLAAATGHSTNVGVRLFKRLPVSAGIGGGSADAGAALRALTRYWSLSPGEPAVMETALQLGTDVPVCLSCRPAFASGVGDELSPAPKLPPAWLVLANPRQPCPTAEVFRAHAEEFGQVQRFEEVPPDARALARILSWRNNGLTSAAASLVPAIVEVLAALESTEGCLLSRMSGSGATGFALFDQEEEARVAVEDILAQHPDWWVVAAPLLANPGSQEAKDASRAAGDDCH